MSDECSRIADRLDRRIQALSWGFLVALSLFGCTFVAMAVGGAEAWQAGAFVTLAAFGVIACLAALNLAQAQADVIRTDDTTGGDV